MRPTFEPRPQITWNGLGLEPSVPLRSLEDAAWLAGLGLAVGLGGAWWWSGHPPLWDALRTLSTRAALLHAWLPAGLLAVLLSGLTLISPHRRLRHVAGPRLHEGRMGVRAAQAWARRSGGGVGHISLAPGLPLPPDLWQRHVLVYGGVGSGKTQILAHVVRQIAATRTRALLLDSKGDWTSLLPAAALICPWDARSVAWDLSRDVATGPQAAAFAQAMIPESDPRNRFWTESSRAILEGCLRVLVARAQPWGWPALHDLLRSDADTLRHHLGSVHPQALQVLTGSDNTVGTVLASLAADTRLVDVCAAAWIGEAPRWSVRDWLRAQTALPRAVVIQAGPDGTVSRTLAGLIITLASARLLDAATPESPHATRLWMVLDELAAAGRIGDLPALFERGRSKGVAVLAGLQAIEQIESIYGRETASALLSMVGCHVVTQCGGGPTRDRIADLIGRRRVVVPTVQQQGNGRASHGLHEETRALVIPGQLGVCLGPWRHRARAWIRALVLPTGADAMVLDWPVVPLAVHRVARRTAAWTRRPQKTAPPVSAPPLDFHDVIDR